MSDRLHDTLTTLRADTDRVGLADAGNVRRRGDQRTRRQAVGSVAAVFLAVAAVAGISAGLGGNDNEGLPPASQSVPSDAFLAADELPDYYPAYTVASRTATVDDAQGSSCLRGLRIDGAAAEGATSYTGKAVDRYPVTSLHAVWRMPSAAAAAQAESQVDFWIASCPGRLHQKTSGTAPSDLGPGRYADHVLTSPAVTEAVAHEALLVVREGSLLSVLSAVNVSQDADAPSALTKVLETMAGRIGADGTDVQPSTLTSDALLPVADLPTLKPYAWSVGETVDPADPADASDRAITACRMSLPVGTDPRHAMLRTYPSDLDALMWEWVGEYADPAQAETAATALQGGCADDGANPQPLQPLKAGASGFTAAKFGADPGSEYHGEVVGVGRTGNVVVVVGLRGMLRAEDSNLDGFAAAAITAIDRVTAATAG